MRIIFLDESCNESFENGTGNEAIECTQTETASMNL